MITMPTTNDDRQLNFDDDQQVNYDDHDDYEDH